MKEILSAESIIVNLASKIELKWVAGSEDPDRPLHEIDVGDHATLIGHLNLIHNNIIQVIGKTECDYLTSLDDDFRNSTLTQLFTHKTVAVILSDDLPVPGLLSEFANRYDVPVLSCKAESNEVVDTARYYLHKLFSNKEIVHGVFIEVLGTGVLITGESSVGKSDALELISRGHRLVADDAPEFTKVGPDVLDGRSPSLLQGFMEVRGLGILNIREMYGDNAIKMNKHLQLIIHMQPMKDANLNEFNRLKGNIEVRQVLEVDIPVTIIPVAPGRNLSVIVEAAVRNHILRHHGYDASQQLIDLQQKAIDNQ